MVAAMASRSSVEWAYEPQREAPGTCTLQVQLLGAFHVAVDGRVIPPTLWSGATRSRALFQYLAYRAGTPVGKEALIDHLWPELEPEASANVLYKAVHLLRRRLSGITGRDGMELLTYDDGHYMLEPAGLWVDVVAFKRAIFETSWCERLGDDAGAMACLDGALRLYRGDLLEDDYLVEWTLVERERLRGQVCSALGQLATRARAAGRTGEAARWYRRLLEYDPCNEPTYLALIEMALEAGRRGEALSLYRQCRETLRRTLEMAPSAEFRALLGL